MGGGLGEVTEVAADATEIDAGDVAKPAFVVPSAEMEECAQDELGVDFGLAVVAKAALPGSVRGGSDYLASVEAPDLVAMVAGSPFAALEKHSVIEDCAAMALPSAAIVRPVIEELLLKVTESPELVEQSLP